jgi:hypothetical protein
MADERLVEVVKRELKARGYEEVEPNPHGGGIWTHPDWDGATDTILVAVCDAFEEKR